MVYENKSKWTRSPSFRKYFTTSFGITKIGNYIRIDFGDERVKFPKDDIVNISEGQIITDKNGFKIFLDLLNKFYNDEMLKKNK